MDKDDKSKDSVESIAPNDVDHDDFTLGDDATLDNSDNKTNFDDQTNYDDSQEYDNLLFDINETQDSQLTLPDFDPSQNESSTILPTLNKYATLDIIDIGREELQINGINEINLP